MDPETSKVQAASELTYELEEVSDWKPLEGECPQRKE
jgi:hypothetical protein